MRQYTTRPALRLYMQESYQRGQLPAEQLQHIAGQSRICIDSAIDCIKHLKTMQELELLDGHSSLILYWAYTSILVLSVPLACELHRRKQAISNNGIPLPQILDNQDDIVIAVRQGLRVLSPSDLLAPTLMRFAQVARNICAAIQVEVQQSNSNHFQSRAHSRAPSLDPAPSGGFPPVTMPASDPAGQQVINPDLRSGDHLDPITWDFDFDFGQDNHPTYTEFYTAADANQPWLDLMQLLDGPGGLA